MDTVVVNTQLLVQTAAVQFVHEYRAISSSCDRSVMVMLDIETTNTCIHTELMIMCTYIHPWMHTYRHTANWLSLE